MVTSKYYWQTIFVLTLANFPQKKSHIANEQKNKSVRCFREIEPQVQKW